MVIYCVCGDKIVVKWGNSSHHWTDGVKQRKIFMDEHKPCRVLMEHRAEERARYVKTD